AQKTFSDKAVASSTNRSTGNVADSRVVSLEFVGASHAPAMESMQTLPGKVNYLRGNDRSKWHTNVPTYSEIGYQGLYPGVDLEYTGVGGDLKGTYTLAPGADPSRIRWHYSGARSTTLDAAGNLQISLETPSTGDQTNKLSLTEHAPLAWQEIQNTRVPVSVSYRAGQDGTIGFELGA